MRKLLFSCFAIFVLGASAGFLGFEALATRWRGYVLAIPAVEYPARLELGERELGEQVAVPFTIANRGTADLIVENIRSNCACTGMERRAGGRFFRIESLRLKPGEHADLTMRVSVSGVRSGSQMVNVVQFATNDPSQPYGKIEAVVGRVTGGIFTEPRSVVFGTVTLGADVRALVDIRDSADRPRNIVGVRSNSDSITAKLIHVSGEAPAPSDERDGVLVARLEVGVSTHEPGDVNGRVDIYVEGRPEKPDSVSVIGRVAPRFELIPSCVTLPRATEAGPVFHAKCVCKSTRRDPFVLLLDSAPEGFNVQFAQCDEPGVYIVNIAWSAAAKNKRPVMRNTICLRAKAQDYDSVIEVPVLLGE